MNDKEKIVEIMKSTFKDPKYDGMKCRDCPNIFAQALWDNGCRIVVPDKCTSSKWDNSPEQLEGIEKGRQEQIAIFREMVDGIVNPVPHIDMNFDKGFDYCIESLLSMLEVGE